MIAFHTPLLRASLLALAAWAPDPELPERIALEGGIVHTMVPGSEPGVATILIADGRVVAVGPDLEIPAGTVRHDLSGSHVVPMLIDGYVNFDPDHDFLYTASGVGLVRDIGGNRAMLSRERDEERRARAAGPSLLSAGALLDGDPPSTAEAVILRSPDAAEKLLPILFEDQIDFLSVFLQLDVETWKRVIELGHEQGLEVYGPVPFAADLDQAIDAGQDGIHFLDALLPQGVIWDIVQVPAFNKPIERLAESKTTVVPILSPNALRLVNQGSRPELAGLFTLLHPSYEVWWKNELLTRVQSMNEERLKIGQRVIDKQAQVLLRLDQAGVPLLLGSGAPQPWLFPGQSIHQELALWVRAGMEPARALHLATRGAAEILGVADEHGSIQAGAHANFIVTKIDPREDIGGLQQSEKLMTRGRLLERSDLEDLLLTLEQKQSKAREEINRDLDVPAPPLPEGGVVVLEGLVDTQAFGLRTSTERFRVVRLPDGKLAFLGRKLYPQEPGQAQRELLVSQVVENGELVEMEVGLRSGEQVMLHKGIWTANRWRMQRQFGEQKVDVTSTLARPTCADIGSVTSLLLLGQLEFTEPFPVLTFHEGLTPEVVAWAMELDDKGTHQLRTHMGRMAFRFNDKGAPVKSLTVVGTSSEAMELTSSDAFGGPGLPLPASKRKIIAEREAAALAAATEAAASAEAEAGEGGDQATPPVGEDGAEDGDADSSEDTGSGDTEDPH